jgi:3-oxoacyl-[acyl-carrier protein] reductase
VELGLEGKRALVTASSRGLGYAVAAGLAVEGADLVLCARDAERLEEAASRLRRATGAEVRAVAANLSDGEEVRSLLGAVGGEGVDMLVHLAGGPRLGGFFNKADKGEWLEQLEQHFFSALWLLHGLVPGIMERGWGRILAVVSRTVKQPRRDHLGAVAADPKRAADPRH